MFRVTAHHLFFLFFVFSAKIRLTHRRQLAEHLEPRRFEQLKKKIEEQTTGRVSFVPLKNSTASLLMTLLVVPDEASTGCRDALDFFGEGTLRDGGRWEKETLKRPQEFEESPLNIFEAALPKAESQAVWHSCGMFLRGVPPHPRPHSRRPTSFTKNETNLQLFLPKSLARNAYRPQAVFGLGLRQCTRALESIMHSNPSNLQP